MTREVKKEKLEENKETESLQRRPCWHDTEIPAGSTGQNLLLTKPTLVFFFLEIFTIQLFYD